MAMIRMETGLKEKTKEELIKCVKSYSGTPKVCSDDLFTFIKDVNVPKKLLHTLIDEYSLIYSLCNIFRCGSTSRTCHVPKSVGRSVSIFEI